MSIHASKIPYPDVGIDHAGRGMHQDTRLGVELLRMVIRGVR